MSALIQQTDPQPRLWTRLEYYQLGDLGLLNGQRTELLNGVVMVRGRQSWPHAATLDGAARMLDAAFAPEFWARQQAPLTLSQFDEPEPDLSVVRGSMHDYTDHPTSAVLIVEVSDFTLQFDRTTKASLYARAGIDDYWIVNLVDHVVEVHRQPVADATQPHGYGYAGVTTHTPGDTIQPLAKPNLTLAVADLLPA